MNSIIDLEVLWGGYYSSKQDDATYSVFRLLDFNKDAYHFSIFEESFESVPTLAQVKELKPFIQHVPQGLGAFFHKQDFRFLGGVVLTIEDLNGYRVYLEAHGASQEYQDEISQRLIAYSKEMPLQIRLELKNDEVIVSQIS